MNIKAKKVIFFVYPCSDVKTEWISDYEIYIEWKDLYNFSLKKKKLDVRKDIYDWRDEQN